MFTLVTNSLGTPHRLINEIPFIDTFMYSMFIVTKEDFSYPVSLFSIATPKQSGYSRCQKTRNIAAHWLWLQRPPLSSTSSCQAKTSSRAMFQWHYARSALTVKVMTTDAAGPVPCLQRRMDLSLGNVSHPKQTFMWLFISRWHSLQALSITLDESPTVWFFQGALVYQCFSLKKEQSFTFCLSTDDQIVLLIWLSYLIGETLCYDTWKNSECSPFFMPHCCTYVCDYSWMLACLCQFLDDKNIVTG